MATFRARKFIAVYVFKKCFEKATVAVGRPVCRRILFYRVRCSGFRNTDWRLGLFVRWLEVSEPDRMLSLPLCLAALFPLCAFLYVCPCQGCRRVVDDGGIAPPALSKGGWRCLSITLSHLTSWFVKIDWKHIYCSYSHTQKIKNFYFTICVIIFEVTIVAERKQAYWFWFCVFLWLSTTLKFFPAPPLCHATTPASLPIAANACTCPPINLFHPDLLVFPKSRRCQGRRWKSV